MFDVSLDGATIRLGAAGTLLIDKPLTINASTLPNGIVVSGDRNSDGLPDSGDVSAFTINLASITEAVTLSSLRITGADLNPDRAGGIQCTGGSLDLQNCELYSCNGTTGGAIHTSGGNLAMQDCQFIECVSQTHGGGIYCVDGGLSVERCAFVKNRTSSPIQDPPNSGAAIHVSSSTGTGPKLSIQILTSRFSENQAFLGRGGGIFVFYGDISIRNSIFELNRSWDGGGAAYLHDCSGELADSHFDANKAWNGGEPRGGALYIRGNGEVSLTGCAFRNNECGPYVHDVGFREGGAVFASCLPAPLTIRDCHFEGNVAPSGGGVCNQGSLVINSTVFERNHAETAGGGAYNMSATLTVLDSTFVENTASTGGGIASIAPARITSTAIVSNHATSTGGGIHNGYQQMMVTSCTLALNSADTGAGAMATGSSSTGFYNCTISINTADGEGIGGIARDVTTGLIYRNCIIANNTPIGNSQASPSSGGSGNNITSGDPLLAPLGVHGGPVRTMPPLPGSPALDGGVNSHIPPDYADLDNDGDTTEPVPYDQRGYPRIAGSAVDIGAVEYDGPRDLPLIFAADGDGDGVPFGVEHALGIDGNSSDLTSPRRFQLGMDSGSSQPKLSFGFNTAALPFTTWSVKRSTNLTPEGWTEIYRYHGPTMTETTNGTTATPMGDLLEITDTDPPPGGAFYRFEAIPKP